jgi:transposase-like protein
MSLNGRTVSNHMKFTQQTRDRYLGSIRSGMRLGEAARAAGVCPSTIRTWRKTYPEFDDACYDAEVDAQDKVEAKLYEVIEEKGDAKLIIFCLTNRSPDRWKTRAPGGSEAPVRKQEAKTTDEMAQALRDYMDANKPTLKVASA